MKSLHSLNGEVNTAQVKFSEICRTLQRQFDNDLSSAQQRCCHLHNMPLIIIINNVHLHEYDKRGWT